MSFRHQFKGIPDGLQGECMGIDSGYDVPALHDLRNRPQLVPILPDKQEPVFLPLAPGGAVISGANQGEQ